MRKLHARAIPFSGTDIDEYRIDAICKQLEINKSEAQRQAIKRMFDELGLQDPTTQELLDWIVNGGE